MKQTSLLKTMLLLCCLLVGGSAWADTTIYSWNGNGSTTTANETGGTAEAKGGNSNVVVGVSQKGNYCLKMNKGFSNTYYIEITLDDNLKTGDKVTIGAFRTSATAAVLGVDFGTTATQTLKDDTDVLASNGTPTDFEITVPAAANGSSKIRLYRNSGSTGMWVSKVVVTTASSGSGETATWTLDPTSAAVMAGQSTTLQLTTNYDGTLNFNSNDDDIAKVSYNSTTKVITVDGIAAGSTTISVTGDATAKYNAINKVISVTVSHAELESNVTDVMSGFGYAYFGLTPSGSNTFAQPESTTNKTDSYGVTISFTQAEGAVYSRFDESYVRFYKGNTLTITAPVGSNITKIVFTDPASGAEWKGTMDVETGDYVNDVKTWYPIERYAFSHQLTETCVRFEYNFWSYGNGQEYRGSKRLAPFITTGMGITHHGGENSGMAMSLLLGAGVKYKIGQRMNLTAEWGVRFSTNDQLDGRSDVYGIKSSGPFKNTDGYSVLQLALTYDLWAKCKTCNNDRY